MTSPPKSLSQRRFLCSLLAPAASFYKSYGVGGGAKRQHAAAGRLALQCGRKQKETKEKKLIFGSWNIRTLLDRDTTERPQRRTALIAKELARYRIDIAALSETRFAEEGLICEPDGGYTFFWKGKAENEDRIHGVGFAIRSTLLRLMSDLPTGINERLMKLRFRISKSRHATVISAYAPTLTSSDEDKEAFYENLDSVIKSTPSSDKLVLLGDFNARKHRANGAFSRLGRERGEERRGEERRGEERRGEERRGEERRGEERRGRAQSTETHTKIHYLYSGSAGLEVIMQLRRWRYL
ncbi:hypothetical protein D4764_08G0003370 [Takifugu flavidus]|uniref:Endonuclease/exonuclease/phosphatase domain-containing protein n=1 Tax=Takifugu flavidus TaxID=433684 RepID=A0A5C6MS87_9TELE|nr:hypothetical protein D4764_08G0003370 [Takifugu flavidus]